MNNLFDECDNSVKKFKNKVDDIINNLGNNPISPELQQKFNNFNNQLNTYEKSIENNEDIHEILKLAKAVGLQASVLGSEIQRDKLVDDSIKLLAKEVVPKANAFREWVETQEESGKPYQSTLNTTQKYTEDKSKKIQDESILLLQGKGNNTFATGFVVANNNLGSFIVTAAHAIESMKNVQVKGVNAEVVAIGGVDKIDLCVLFVENTYFTPLTLQEENCDSLQVKFTGFFSHRPPTYKLKTTYGSIKTMALHFSDNSIELFEVIIDGTHNEMERGNSGAPLICQTTNNVVGVMLQRGKNGKLGYAVPIKYLQNIWEEMSDVLQSDNTQINKSKLNLSIPTNIYIDKKSKIEPVLGVKTIANRLSSIIINQPDDSGMMIGIFGKWGRGKTYLAEQTWKELHNYKPKFKRIIFSAWKYQDTKSLWAYLYENFIDSYLDKQEEETLKDKIKNYYSITKKIWKLNLEKHKWFPIISFGLLLVLAIVWTFFVDKVWLIKLLISTFGIVVLIKIFLLYISQKESAIGLYRKYFSKKSYNDYLGFQSEVEHELTNLLKTWIPEANEDEKIILFVDDIDRCNIEQIISIIDGLRVILDNPVIHERLIIITAIDEEILKVALQHKYKNVEDESLSRMYTEYLEKIFIIGLKLNPLNNHEVQEFLNNILPNKEKSTVFKTESINSLEIVPQEVDVSSSSNQENRLLMNGEQNDELSVENSAQQIDDYEISDDEQDYLLEIIKKLKNPTPRKVRIFYYKYLIMKQLFDIRLKEKGLTQSWYENSDGTVIADILILMANGEDFEKFGNDENEEIINELKYVVNMVSVL
ncbi:MAG TPA: serine protease [Arcobacter sp.]|nr:serine protease [Arcobacter sp.]